MGRGLRRGDCAGLCAEFGNAGVGPPTAARGERRKTYNPGKKHCAHVHDSYESRDL
jgi:hypothetical protein